MSERKITIIGNWKMNKTYAQTVDFIEKFEVLHEKHKDHLLKNLVFGLAIPNIYLQMLITSSLNQKMILASQNLFHQQQGAYTGEVNAKMLQSLGVGATIIGHSERRQFFHESDQEINLKVKAALNQGIKAILCVGETLTQRQDNSWKSVLQKQIQLALADVDPLENSNIIIAYEPVWAIGTGLVASPEQAQEACLYVRKQLSELWNEEVSQKVTIQYGGSVKPANISEILAQPDIDGALVGGASLDPNSFIDLLMRK